ncbi:MULTISPECIES: AbiJ-NTD4 domain-containing protein [unclassified Microbacterium]|uniref:AbiJ-NTD4 domain-containing protein n=1 Tax=unclassified Microbacterium TaxID=2609290 RepID=UPI0030169A1A
MSFADRFGYTRPEPQRTQVERDSDAVRLVLWNAVSRDGKSPLAAHRKLCEYSQQLPDANIWSDTYADESARLLLDQMTWLDVYEALEAEASTMKGQSRAELQKSVNRALSRSGIAYEMRDGRFEFYEPVANEFETRHDEDEAIASLTDEFETVRKQYQNALRNLRSMPANLEGAVADALNALEAVAKIIEGKPHATLGDVARNLFPGSPGYHVPLRLAIEKLYAYSNQLPGARHGRYAEPDIAHAETVMVVRMAGAILTFLVTLYRGEATAGNSGSDFDFEF